MGLAPNPKGEMEREGSTAETASCPWRDLGSCKMGCKAPLQTAPLRPGPRHASAGGRDVVPRMARAPLSVLLSLPSMSERRAPSPPISFLVTTAAPARKGPKISCLFLSVERGFHGRRCKKGLAWRDSYHSHCLSGATGGGHAAQSIWLVFPEPAGPARQRGVAEREIRAVARFR